MIQYVEVSLWSIFCVFSEARKGKKWCRLIDTHLDPPKDITIGGNNGVDPIYHV